MHFFCHPSHKNGFDRNIYIHIYAIMKTMCPPAYHHNGFMATHALGHMMYGWEHHELLQTHCGENREGTLFS